MFHEFNNEKFGLLGKLKYSEKLELYFDNFY